MQRDLPGVYNVAADGWLTRDELRALVGRKVQPSIGPEVMERVLRRLFRAGLVDVPPTEMPYLQHPWVVAVDRLRAEGWAPRHTNEETVLACLGGRDPGSTWKAAATAAAGAGLATTGLVAAGALRRRRRSCTSGPATAAEFEARAFFRKHLSLPGTVRLNVSEPSERPRAEARRVPGAVPLLQGKVRADRPAVVERHVRAGTLDLGLKPGEGGGPGGGGVEPSRTPGGGRGDGRASAIVGLCTEARPAGVNALGVVRHGEVSTAPAGSVAEGLRVGAHRCRWGRGSVPETSAPVPSDGGASPTMGLRPTVTSTSG